MDPIIVLDKMLDEVHNRPRETPHALTGGGKQWWDGEGIGRYIRERILTEVRDELIKAQEEGHRYDYVRSPVGSARD